MFQYDGPSPALHTVNTRTLVEKAVPKTLVGDNDPAYSADGSQVAFARNGAIWVMSANGTHKKRLTSDAGGRDWPCWSPDGTEIAYSSTQDGQSGTDIYVMSADGTDQVRVTTSPGTDYQPTWSVSGQLAFTSYRVDNTAQLFVMHADGSHQVDLTNNTSYSDSDPDWSPNGKLLVFSDAGRDHPGSIGPDLWTMHANGADVTAFVHQQDYSDGEAPAWSPNGRQVAFRANNGTGGSQIWVANADGSAQTMVAGDLSENVGDDNPSWQPRP